MPTDGLRRRTFLRYLTFPVLAGALLAKFGLGKTTGSSDVILYKGWIVKTSDLDL